jgi:putative DNA primase/helicase
MINQAFQHLREVKLDNTIIKIFRADPSLNFMAHGLYVEDEDLFYLWRDGLYTPLFEIDLKKRIWKFLELYKDAGIIDNRYNIGVKKINDLYAGLKFAHDYHRSNSSSSLVTFSDGMVLNTDSFIVCEGAPYEYSFYGFQFPSTVLSNSAKPLLFEKFLDEVLIRKDGSRDEELKILIQEIFGYCLTNSTAAHKAFFFYGSGRNGKSVLLNILSKLIDPKYISNMTIQNLSKNNFALGNLIGKRVNIAGEEESNYIKSDLFKCLVAGDPITADRKHRDPIEFKPQVKFIFGTNEIPVFDSANTAIRERIMLIPFNKYITEEEQDRSLSKKLEHELDQIFVWALNGAKRLVHNGYKFTVPQSVKEMAEVFSEEQSSVLEFIKEECHITGDREDFVIPSVLYADYQEWCKDNGRMAKGSKKFRKDIMDVYGEKVEFGARRLIGTTEKRVAIGIKLNRLPS